MGHVERFNPAYLALQSRRPGPWLAAAGLSLGLAIGCRPSLIGAFGGLGLVVAVVALRKPSRETSGSRLRSRILPVLAAGVPFAAVLAGLLAYNAARFGNPLEFGFDYQLTATSDQAKVRHFSLTFVPFNLRTYFVAAPQWGRYFPFIHPIRSMARPAGYYGIEYIYGALVVCPLIWLCGLFPAWIVRRKTNGPVSYAWFLFAVGLGTTGLLVGFNSAAGRYVVDLLPWWVWLGLLGWAMLERGLTDRGSRRLAGSFGWAFAVCALFSCAVAFFQSADIHGILKFENLASYNRISRWFDTPTAIWEKLTGQRLGALEMDIVFSEKPAGAMEPLVVTGVEYQTDYIFVFFKSPLVVRLGYLTSGGLPVMGEEAAIVPGRSYHLRIEEGSLFPPEGHPIYDGWRPSEIRSVKSWVTITMDDRPVLTISAPAHEASPGSLQIGRDSNAGWCGREFGGVIRDVHRDDLRRPKNGENGSGDVSLDLRFPPEPEAQIQPLVVLGRTGQADLIGLRMIDRDHFTLYYESWGGGTRESAAFAVPPSRDATLRLRMGAVYKGGGGPANTVLGDSIVAWLDGAPIWWARELLDIGPDAALYIGVNAIGSSAMTPYFQGRIEGWSRGPGLSAWRPGAFGALEMDLAGRGSGLEPLVATGPSGFADTLAFEWLSGDQARLVYDHWGMGASYSPPFDWSSGRIHTLRVEMPSFSRLDARAPANSGAGRVRAQLDGRTIWEASVQFYVVRSDTLAIGRNPAGSTLGGRSLSCVVADVRQFDQDAAQVQR